MVMEADSPIGLVAARRRLADVVHQCRPAQHQIRFVFQGNRLPQHRQRMLVDVFMLMVFVDGHLHVADLGQHDLAEAGLHHQLDTRHRIGTQQHLVQFHCNPLHGDTPQLRSHRGHRLAHPISDPELQLRDEPRRPQHPQRVVSEGHRGRGRGVQHPLLNRRQSTQRVQELPRSVRGDPDGHRVDREVAPQQVVLKAITETHLRIAGHLVIAVGAKGGDLQPLARLTHADGAVLDSGVPDRVGPGAHDLLHLVRSGIGSEVEVGGQSAEDSVANAATHEIELMTRGGEQRADLAQQRGLALQFDGGGSQQLVGWSDFGHSPVSLMLVAASVSGACTTGACSPGALIRASYYRLGVGGREGQTTTATRTATREPCGRPVTGDRRFRRRRRRSGC